MMLRFLFGALLAFHSVGVQADEQWVCPETGQTFMTGAAPTPPEVLAQYSFFTAAGTPPKHVAYIPQYRSMFGNDRYGVCVTSEEAFAKSCFIPGVQHSIELKTDTVLDWAREHGWLHGAPLGPVLDAMERKGFQVPDQLYNNGTKRLVDYRDHPTLRRAIAQGPVKVAIRASALGAGAGSRDGWYALGGRSSGSDHCVSLCGYGTAEWLFGELECPIPAKLSPDEDGYLLYTWGHIGFVDESWVSGNVREAWIRDPTTIGDPPLNAPRVVDTFRWGFFVLIFGGIAAVAVAGYFLYRRYFP